MKGSNGGIGHLQGPVPVQSELSDGKKKGGEEEERKKEEEKERCADWGGGRDKKGFSILFDSRVSAPSFSAQPRQLLTPHACLQSCALHCFLKYLLR